jgi:N-acetylneuraminic acid mutarotase
MHPSLLHAGLFVLSTCSVFALPHHDQAKPNCWKALAPVGDGPRAEGGIVAINKDIYDVGGMTMGEPRGQLNTVEVYNIDTNKWSRAPSMPVALHHPNVATVNGKIYVTGGLAGSSPHRITLGNVLSFDPVVGKWEELAPMPNGTARGASAVATNGNVIYVAGGLQPIDGVNSSGVTNLVSSYDTVSKRWTMLPNLPGNRDHVGAAFIKDTLYVVGGRLGSQFSVQGTVFALKSNATEWKSLAGMPTPRGGMAVAAIGTKIYTFGGEGNPAPGSKGVWPQVESYDTVTDKWQKEAPMKNPRHGTGAVTVNDVIYIPGGGATIGGNESVALTEAYSPSSC